MAKKGRRRRRKQVGLGGVLLFLFLAMVVVAAVYLAYRTAGPPAEPVVVEEEPAAAPSVPPAQERPVPSSEPEVVAPVTPQSQPESLPEALPASGEARIALVIDDLGRRVADVHDLEALGVPVSYAVLPFESRTPQVLAALEDHGAEVLLHLPMEGRDGATPGPGALRAGMAAAELAAATGRALEAVPTARGVNNHMGSVLTADALSMRAVLEVVAERGLFFLDSRTSPQSVAFRTAVDLGIPTAERQVFLDPDPAPEAVRFQFRRLLGVSRDRGAAIAIGHPHPATLEVLRQEVPRARELGYRFVPVSELLERTGLPP
ncbi:MAG: divergent polysaccharide deacetylase family protein [Acidobacteriota bacterium]